MYLMQAAASTDGTIVTWTSATPDWPGADYPGAGTPENIVVAAVFGESGGGEGGDAAVVFDGADNIRSNRPDASSVDDTRIGITNFGSGSGGVTANYGTIGGGNDNSAAAISATVAGGDGNGALGIASSVGGGQNNEAGSDGASVGGGVSNVAGGENSTIGGGNTNSAAGAHAALGGGQNNSVTADADETHGTIAGGSYNTVSSTGGAIGGGGQNVVSGESAFIAGGFGGVASRAGQYAHAHGFFDSAGDAQFGRLVLRGEYVDGLTLNCALEEGKAYAIRATCVLINVNTGDRAALFYKLLASREPSGNAVVDAVEADPANTTLENGTGWEITFSGVSINLRATFTGLNGQRAVLVYEWTEIGGLVSV